MLRLLPLCALVAVAFPALSADKNPIGPELAPKEIGHLIKAYPMLTQNNPQAPDGVGVLLWGCDYLVGKARITITITTRTSDPMPCKRQVAFE
jgi:hypothetical protein